MRYSTVLPTYREWKKRKVGVGGREAMGRRRGGGVRWKIKGRKITG